ncbi:MAG: hypothetical protein E6G38_03590, partial [Actinobacteria bacterium]
MAGTSLSVSRPTIQWRAADFKLQSRYLARVLLLAAAYYASAKLYLWGLRRWPGIVIAELAVNGELLHSLPVGSLIGQHAGNMAEVVVGAVLLRQLIGQRSALDRPDDVGGMLVAIGTATAISATVGTVSMLLGGVIAG